MPKITDPMVTDHGTRNANQGRTTLLPSMPDRVQKIAIAMAVLGFLSFAIAGNVAAAVMNAAIWVGIVYLVFLLAYGVRRVIRHGSRPPDGTSPKKAVPGAGQRSGRLDPARPARDRNAPS